MGRSGEKVVLVLALLAPLVLTFVVMPRFFSSFFGSGDRQEAPPEVQGVIVQPAATPAARTTVAPPAGTPAPTWTAVPRATPPTPTAPPKPAAAATLPPPPRVPATATPLPASAANAPAPSAPQAARPANGTGPDHAVVRFYEQVQRGDWGGAEALWSSRMRSAYPPQENIVQRFADTERLIVEELSLLSVDEANGRATVAVGLFETLNSGGTRRFGGTWQLVRQGDTWLLDQPNLAPQ